MHPSSRNPVGNATGARCGSTLRHERLLSQVRFALDGV